MVGCSFHTSLSHCAGTQPYQQFYDTSLFSPDSGPFSVNNCTLYVYVLPTNDPPVIDLALPGTCVNVLASHGFGCVTPTCHD